MNHVIEWEQRFSVGHEDIDSQHKKLVDILNRLGEGIHSNSDELIDRVLNSLTQYTMYHFMYEEALLEQTGYPEKEQHKQMYRQFVDKILHCKETFESDETLDIEALYLYLREWLMNHICVADKRMMQWMDQTDARFGASENPPR